MLQGITSQAIKSNLAAQGSEAQTIEIESTAMGKGEIPTKEAMTLGQLAAKMRAMGIKDPNDYFSRLAETGQKFVKVTMATKGPDGKPRINESTWGFKGKEGPANTANAPQSGGDSQAAAQTSTASSRLTGQLRDIALRGVLLGSNRTPVKVNAAADAGTTVLQGLSANDKSGSWTIPDEYRDALSHAFKGGKGAAGEMIQGGVAMGKNILSAGVRGLIGLFSGPSWVDQATSNIAGMRLRLTGQSYTGYSS